MYFIFFKEKKKTLLFIQKCVFLYKKMKLSQYDGRCSATVGSLQRTILNSSKMKRKEMNVALGQRFSLNSLYTNKKGMGKENDRGKNGKLTGKELQVIPPAVNKTKAKVFCDRTNCKCEVHHLKRYWQKTDVRKNQTNAFYSSYQKIRTSIHGSFGDFVDYSKDRD